MHLPNLLFVMVSHRGSILWGWGAAFLEDSAFRAAGVDVDKVRVQRSGYSEVSTVKHWLLNARIGVIVEQLSVDM